MTVRMLMDYGVYKAGNLVTDAASEAGMIAAKVADSNLTGGTTYVPAVSNIHSDFDARFATDPLTGVVTGLVGPTGDFLVVSSTAPSNGDGRPNGTVYIQTV